LQELTDQIPESRQSAVIVSFESHINIVSRYKLTRSFRCDMRVFRRMSSN
jgi:adenosyl cobinamide kinase/adenosyl cobinamide phosphate guanylyltransferase